MRKWLDSLMLPGAIVLGTSLYIIYHFTPALHVHGWWLHPLASDGQRLVIAILLFFQFVKISPHDLVFTRWHAKALAIQAGLFLALAAVVALLQPSPGRMLLECAMLCFICPTAAAAGVITSKIGGSLPGIMTYTVLSDTLACVLIPLMIPLVHPAAEISFLAAFWAIVKRVFSILVLPCVLAWLIRYLLPGVQRWLARYVGWAFYVWGPMPSTPSTRRPSKRSPP